MGTQSHCHTTLGAIMTKTRSWKSSRTARMPRTLIFFGSVVLLSCMPLSDGVFWAAGGHRLGSTPLWMTITVMAVGYSIGVLGIAMLLRARKRVRAMEGLCCPQCDYDLRSLRKDISLCPECGLAIDLNNMHDVWGGWITIKKYPRIRDDFLDLSASPASAHSAPQNAPAERRLQ